MLPPKQKKAVILLSGGVDSATTMAIAKAEGYELFALSINYGQRHARELRSARKLAKFYHVREHKVLDLNLACFGGSALTDRKIKVPERRNISLEEIPATYVPARNMVLLSLATAWAETVGADTIFIGANAVDYSGYPDCRPEFINAFQNVVMIGTKSGVEGKKIEIKAPLIGLKKSEIIRRGVELGVPYDLTWSCYKGGKKACGVCDSCQLRLKGFGEAGVVDPLPYRKASSRCSI